MSTARCCDYCQAHGLTTDSTCSSYGAGYCGSCGERLHPDMPKRAPVASAGAGSAFAAKLQHTPTGVPRSAFVLEVGARLGVVFEPPPLPLPAGGARDGVRTPQKLNAEVVSMWRATMRSNCWTWPFPCRLVAFDAATAAVAGAIYFEHKGGHIACVAVAPRFRGRRVAKLLLAAAVEQLLADRAALCVLPNLMVNGDEARDNPHLKALYNSMGLEGGVGIGGGNYKLSRRWAGGGPERLPPAAPEQYARTMLSAPRHAGSSSSAPLLPAMPPLAAGGGARAAAEGPSLPPPLPVGMHHEVVSAAAVVAPAQTADATPTSAAIAAAAAAATAARTIAARAGTGEAAAAAAAAAAASAATATETPPASASAGAPTALFEGLSVLDEIG